MREAWIDLECPNCGEIWEETLSDLPSPDGSYTCRHCGDGRPMSEFAQMRRDLEVLEAFHRG